MCHLSIQIWLFPVIVNLKVNSGNLHFNDLNACAKGTSCSLLET